MEYYPAIKNYEILTFAKKWFQLESILISEISQFKKNKYYIISLIEQLCAKYKNNKKTCKQESTQIHLEEPYIEDKYSMK